MSERLECRATLLRTLGLCALGVVMTAAASVVIWSGNPVAVVAGLVGTVFFGYCTVRLLVDAWRGGSRIIISELGIDDRRGGIGLVKWEDIQAVRIQHQGPNRFMCIDVEDPQRYLAVLPWHTRWIAKANASLGFSPITLNFAAMRPGLDEAMAFIRDRYEQTNDSPRVEITETGVSIRGWVGQAACVDFKDIQSVSIVTTDEGPAKPDVFWVLRSDTGECMIPQEADPEGKLLAALQTLPGFDNQRVIEAMGSTERAEFNVWDRTESSDEPLNPDQRSV